MTEPGVYHVSMQGIRNHGIDRAFVLGDHGSLYGAGLDTMIQGCWILIDELMCTSSFTLVVDSASPSAPHGLPLYITGDYGPACTGGATCTSLPGYATVAVYKVGGASPSVTGLATPGACDDGGCTTSFRRDLQKFERRLEKQVR